MEFFNDLSYGMKIGYGWLDCGRFFVIGLNKGEWLK